MAGAIPFVRAMSPRYGEALRLSPLVRRIVAPNPGPFTFTGTGTYLVGRGEVAVIDPGPDLDSHVRAILAATEGERITRILVTHTHADHCAAAPRLAAETGAPTCGYGPHGSGRVPGDAGAPEDVATRVEEGADTGFLPDITLRDGDRIEGAGWCLETLWTPGHTSNHLCFALAAERALFTGDHVMGWSTSVIAPPDGDMAAYLASLERLLARPDAIYWPTHGPPIHAPRRFVAALIAHRRAREAAIVAAIRAGHHAIRDIVAAVYTETPKALHPAAGLSVLAHCRHLAEQGRLCAEGPPGPGCRWRVTDRA
ncbi:MAG: MBL fold metallo-hydrolase [Alphaproteobacteria bacterium]|nr:MAG: MBL fold metallo-hydrolase [Alphaproteobacteria bacterium]